MQDTRQLTIPRSRIVAYPRSSALKMTRFMQQTMRMTTNPRGTVTNGFNGEMLLELKPRVSAMSTVPAPAPNMRAKPPPLHTADCALLWAFRCALVATAVFSHGTTASPVFAVLFLSSVLAHGPYIRFPTKLYGYKPLRCKVILWLSALLSAINVVLVIACFDARAAESLKFVGYRHLTSEASQFSNLFPSIMVLILAVWCLVRLKHVQGSRNAPLSTLVTGVVFLLLLTVTSVQPSIPSCILLGVLVISMLLWTDSSSADVWRPDLKYTSVLVLGTLLFNSAFIVMG